MNCQEKLSKVIMVGEDLDLVEYLEREGITVAGYYSQSEKMSPLNHYGNYDALTQFIVNNEFKASANHFILAAYYPPERAKAYQMLEQDNLVKFCCKSADISLSASIGTGSTIAGRCFIGKNVRIGKGCKINVGAQLHHDVSIGDFVTIAPGAILLGAASVGDYSLIGSAAVIRQYRSVGDHCYVGMGAVVTSNIASNLLIYGNPAREIRSYDGSDFLE